VTIEPLTPRLRNNNFLPAMMMTVLKRKTMTTKPSGALVAAR